MYKVTGTVGRRRERRERREKPVTPPPTIVMEGWGRGTIREEQGGGRVKRKKRASDSRQGEERR